jgi:CRP/FNR family transcriptional regulator
MQELNKAHNYSSCTIGASECHCFEKLTPDQKDFLDENSVIINYQKNEILNKQGGLVSHILYMEEGLAKVFMNSKKDSLVLKLIPPGNFIGLAASSEKQNVHQYSSMAYVDSKIRQIDVSAFRELIKQNASFAKDIIDILSANSVQIYNRFFCLLNKQSYGRLADIILCLSDRIFMDKEFCLPISRKEIAELAGMRAETVIRILKKFSEENLIEINNKNVKILDYERLNQISETG